MMFGAYAKQTYYYEEAYDAFDIARVVFEDLKTPVTKEDLIEEVASGSVVGLVDDDDYEPTPSNFNMWTNEEKQEYWNQLEIKRGKQAAEFVEKFLIGREDLTFFIVSYSDNSGPQEAAMEHADIFKRLPSLRISHH